MEALQTIQENMLTPNLDPQVEVPQVRMLEVQPEPAQAHNPGSEAVDSMAEEQAHHIHPVKNRDQESLL